MRGRRNAAVSAIICALASTVLAGVVTTGAEGGVPGPGFKSCATYRSHHEPFRLYAKHVSCRKALRVQRAYERGTDIYERRWNEYCLKDFPGWCCIGGGGAVTCRRHNSISVSMDPSIDPRSASS